MKHPITLMLLVLVAASMFSTSRAAERIGVLVIVGGHRYETNQFHELFRQNTELEFDIVGHPQAHPCLRPEAWKDYDVLVLYDMWQEISEEAKTNLVNRLKAGTGLVALHHSLANYQQWPEYERIVGGRFHLKGSGSKGVERSPSIWKHDVEFKVRIADPDHPVTRGLTDFEIRDETYGLFDVLPDSHPLLTTEEPTSGRVIGWARTYEGSRIVYLQPGHDHHAYENADYRRLVWQAIRWAAQRD